MALGFIARRLGQPCLICIRYTTEIEFKKGRAPSESTYQLVGITTCSGEKGLFGLF